MDNIVENYGWNSEEAPCSCNYIVPEILKLLAQLKVKRVLDLGSGNGNLCFEMSKSGVEVVGVEYDRQGVAIAKSNYAGIPFYNFGVQDNPSELLIQEPLFDAVVSTEVIEHLFSPHLLPIYAAKVLKQDGILILTTPYHGYLKNLVLSVLGKWDRHLTALWHGGHIKFWSRETLSELLRQNGFQVTGFTGVGRIPYLWKSMVLIAQKLPEA
jgi:2-polyprenyl-3-methyl-5-hydroxy-6-metoxy-1,4-benzoquinol methylase